MISRDYTKRIMTALTELDTTMGGILHPSLWAKEDSGGITIARVYLYEEGAWGYICITPQDVADISHVKRQAYQIVYDALRKAGFAVNL